MQDPNRQATSMSASWSNLWDQTEAVSQHTQRGIDFLDRFGQFLKERAAIEEEYASRLRSLVKRSRGKKNDEEECKLYSYMNAFYAVLGELDSLAAQHEVIGERLKRDVVPKLNEKAQNLATGRKKHCATFKSLNVAVEDSVENMKKAQKVYVKTFKEAEVAHIKHDKAEKNMELSRLDVERAKNNVHQKNQICEQAKQSYAHTLEMANHAQHEHLNVKLPGLLEEMRRLDVDRIESTKQAMLESVQAETSVANIVQRCYGDMQKAISCIDSEKDTMVVVVQHKTGYAFPQEHVFDDLGSPAAILSTNGESMVDASGTLKRNSSTSTTKLSSKNGNGKAVARKHSMHQRLFGGTSSSKSNGGGSADGYANLPPQQRCRKIEIKLDELGKELETLRQARVGLDKMFEVFQNNPKMGKANDVAQQLHQNHKEIEEIGEKIERFKTLLALAQSELNTPLGGDHHHHNNQLRAVASYSTGATNSVSMVNTSGTPGASPRMHASSASLAAAGAHQRASYSEESSVSSTEGAGGAFARASFNSSAGADFKSPNAAASAISTMSLVSNNSNVINNNIQHIDAGSGDFYEECDASATTAKPTHQANPIPAAKINGNAGGCDGFGAGPVLGTCTALYPFEGSTDGTTIAMREGDEMLLLERDEGDGWTRVRLANAPANGDAPMEGFVPTTYLQCRWYPTTT